MAVKAQLPRMVMSFVQMRCQFVVDRAGVGELAHLDVGAAVADHLDAFGTRRRMAATLDDEIGTESADDGAYGVESRLRSGICVDRNRGRCAKSAAVGETRGDKTAGDALAHTGR